MVATGSSVLMSYIYGVEKESPCNKRYRPLSLLNWLDFRSLVYFCAFRFSFPLTQISSPVLCCCRTVAMAVQTIRSLLGYPSAVPTVSDSVLVIIDAQNE